MFVVSVLSMLYRSEVFPQQVDRVPALTPGDDRRCDRAVAIVVRGRRFEERQDYRRID